MNCLDVREREATLTELTSTEFDLVVIGGGITGAGILRDAALRGLRTALIEAEDFASGTSSKSTKLIHGGIRYLAMGQVHVVREAARERKRVNRIAPHLAEPTWLTLPAHNRLQWLMYVVGVNVYERLGQVAKADLHFNLSGEALADHEPLIDGKRYPYACVYREYLTDDARLVMANIRAGTRQGGIAASKLEVTGLIKDHGKISGVRATCTLTGAELVVRGKAVINAAGPWVESVCKLDGLNAPKAMVLSKGIHIVVPRDRLPLSQMVLTVTEDKRPVFAIPRGDVIYIGTTDSRYLHNDLWPEVTRDEIRYLYRPVADYFGVELGADDCLTTWAGLRPLIAQSGRSTKEISRRDEIWVSESGLITIAGGKLTGYRKMAEDTVNQACKVLGVNRPEPSEDTPLPGGDFAGSVTRLAREMVQRFDLPESRARRLALLYGNEAAEVIEMGPEPLAPGVDVLAGEVKWALSNEAAHALEDVLYRRTRAALYAPTQMTALIAPVAEMMAERLGWTAVRREAEEEATRARFAADSQVLEA